MTRLETKHQLDAVSAGAQEKGEVQRTVERGFNNSEEESTRVKTTNTLNNSCAA